MNRTVFILNGPNLNLLGRREPHIYGYTTLDQIRESSEQLADELDLVCDFRQTNHEGVMVDWIQEAFEQGAALIINPAGLSFNSIPVLDALKLIDAPLVELHLSNIHARDELHRHSIMSGVVDSVICGMGADGYPLAIRAINDLLRHQAATT
ncbi:MULTISPECIES: type II 3-dehydroquinate dehydratase [unclassified Pseudomonas]|uniref:type II 3-dehydroquinate dehydratase n=1 Tax=unclassified Pseudomonas TaxID=196821 RepID=UPI0004866342|nr:MULTISPECIES: type II 3-dehydroquinate dehydratase [unclassified Pseudomonas]PXX64526.1 3-dehydroquinate dehydratase [Pseudomonas sp. LAIL14HWK12:I1]SMD12446.1 3-dehydroquinate dehydratase [Pseudomonas sp. URIL14HWK12:I5]SOC98456.1 3-dehydroquinate dehydratase [Pseudomonas sp. LAIL14HWK12:I3]